MHAIDPAFVHFPPRGNRERTAREPREDREEAARSEFGRERRVGPALPCVLSVSPNTCSVFGGTMLNRGNVTLDGVAEEQVGPAVYVVAAIVLGLIGFFGFTMNLLVALVIVKDAQTLWTPVNVILVNLVVSVARTRRHRPASSA